MKSPNKSFVLYVNETFINKGDLMIENTPRFKALIVPDYKLGSDEIIKSKPAIIALTFQGSSRTYSNRLPAPKGQSDQSPQYSSDRGQERQELHAVFSDKVHEQI